VPPDVWKGSAFPYRISSLSSARLRLVGAGVGARVPSMKDRRIVIVGFMGCGKTTVADALARQLGCESMDLDSFITQSEGRSPAEIIEQDGEAAFREIETQALRDALESNDARVIALGGGAWPVDANRALVAEHNCLSVWLDAPFELCWDRIISSANTIRPMAPDRERAQRLFQVRRDSYELAHLRLVMSKTTAPDETVVELATSLLLT
jgi:shikimate kinase